MKKFLMLSLMFLPFNVLAEVVASGTNCGTNCSWKIEDGVLTITGYGDIDDFPRSCTSGCHNTAPWAENAQIVQKIVIENEPNTNGFSSIGNGVFAAMHNVQEAVLPEGLQNIKTQAFIGDGKLKIVNLPSSLTSIESYAFDDTRLTSIEIPNGITKLDACVFGNTNITSIVIPENITSINPLAFTISTGESSTPLAKIYCPEHLLAQCATAVSFRTDAGLEVEIAPYQKTADGKIFYKNQWYNSANDIASGNNIKKRIYTVEEAAKLSKPTGNTFKIKYK